MNEEAKSPSLSRQPGLTFTINLSVRKNSEDPTNPENESSEIDQNFNTIPDEDAEVLGQYFRIELFSDNPIVGEGKENIQNSIATKIPDLLQLLSSHVPLHTGIIKRICVVEPDILGEVIFQVQKELGLKPEYTGQDGYYHTAAKTISYLNADNICKSIIVLNSGIFVSVIQALWEGNNYEDWSTDEQLFFYIIAHEYGHALDNWLRKHVSKDEDIPDKEINWEKIAEYSAPNAFNEYLACVFAKSCVTPKLQESMQNNLDNDLENFNKVLIRKRNAFVSDYGEIVHCYWTTLIQLAKLIGHEKDEIDFPLASLRKNGYESDERKEQLQEIVNEFAKTLQELKQHYPVLPNDKEITVKLIPYFLRLAAVYNFFFEKEITEDEKDSKKFTN